MEPKVRFKGFSGEWNVYTIGDIAPVMGGYAFQSEQFSNSGIAIVRISNILDTGIIGGDFVKYDIFTGDTSFRLYSGDILIAMSGATTGKVAIVKTDKFLYQNQRVGKFSRTDKINYSFLASIVGSNKFRLELNKRLTSSAQPNASSRDIDSIQQYLPNDIIEQGTIASFFSSIDSTIISSAKKLASLKKLKSASLVAMFPQQGETTPKVRFKGFEGEWKRHTLYDVLKINSGKDYKHLESGNIPVYGTGGYMLSVNDSLSNLDAIGIGRKGTIDKPQYLKAPFWTVDTLFFLTKKNNDNLFFLYNLVQNINWKKYDESTGVPSLSKNNLERVEIHMPNLAEQQAIATFFRSLDRKIALETARLEKLKQIKQACLDKMFV